MSHLATHPPALTPQPSSKSMPTRDLRTAESATKTLERAAIASSSVQRSVGVGQRLALLGRLSTCMAALAAEEVKDRYEITKAKEYALWMGGINDDEDELYRTDTAVITSTAEEATTTVDASGGDGEEDDGTDGRLVNTHITTTDAGLNTTALIHPPHPKSTFSLSAGAKKTLKDPAFVDKASKTRIHQAFAQEALRHRAGCLFWATSFPFNLDAQERSAAPPLLPSSSERSLGTTQLQRRSTSPTQAVTPQPQFTRSLRCGRPDSALTSLRTGGRRVGAAHPSSADDHPPPSRAVVYRHFFPTDDPNDAQVGLPDRILPSPTATVTELQERCICLRASVPTGRNHRYAHPITTTHNIDGLHMMVPPPPLSDATSRRGSSSFSTGAEKGWELLDSTVTPPILVPSRRTSVGAVRSFSPSTSPGVTSLLSGGAPNITTNRLSSTQQRTTAGIPPPTTTAPLVVTSDVILEYGVETDLRPRWEGGSHNGTLPFQSTPLPLPSSSSLPSAANNKAASAASFSSVVPSGIPPTTTAPPLPSVILRDEISLVSREVADFIHYTADAMDHASAVRRACRVQPLPPPPATTRQAPLPPRAPSGGGEDAPDALGETGDQVMDRLVIAGGGGNDEQSGNEDDGDDATTMIEAAMTDAQRHGKKIGDQTESLVDNKMVVSPPRKDATKRLARAFRVAINKVLTDEDEQRWGLVHAERAADKRLYRLFRIDHAKAQRDLLSAQRTARRDLERVLTLDILKLVVVWESQHNELFSLFKSQHATLRVIAVGRSILGTEEDDARECLERYEGIGRRLLRRTCLEERAGELAGIQLRYETEMRRIKRDQDNFAMREQILEEADELERQCREDEQAQREAEARELAQRERRALYLDSL